MNAQLEPASFHTLYTLLMGAAWTLPPIPTWVAMLLAGLLFFSLVAAVAVLAAVVRHGQLRADDREEEAAEWRTLEAESSPRPHTPRLVSQERHLPGH